MNAMERKAKVVITLRPEVLNEVRARVASGQAGSVSAYIEQAVVGQLAAEANFDELITEMLAATNSSPMKE